MKGAGRLHRLGRFVPWLPPLGSLAAANLVALPAQAQTTINQYGNCNAGLNSTVTCHIYGASKREVEKLSKVVTDLGLDQEEATRVVNENHEQILVLLQHMAELEDRDTLLEDEDRRLQEQLDQLLVELLEAKTSQQRIRQDLDALSRRVDETRSVFSYSRNASALTPQVGFVSELNGFSAEGKVYRLHGVEFDLTWRQRIDEHWLLLGGGGAGILAPATVSGVRLVADTRDGSVLGSDEATVRPSYWQGLVGAAYETAWWLFTVRSGLRWRSLEVNPEALPPADRSMWEVPVRLGAHLRVLGGWGFFLDGGPVLSWHYTPLGYVFDSDRLEAQPAPAEFAVHLQAVVGASYAYSF